MAYTLLDIKKGVSTQLGKTDYATANTVRDAQINVARREFYTAAKWSWAKKTATLTFSSGSAAFPSNYDPTFDIGEIYSYSGTDKTTYTEVNLEDLDTYTDDDASNFVFAIDFENSVIKSNQQSATPSITYQRLPADKALDGTDDSETELAPNINPIITLSIGHYWLAAERDEEAFDRFQRLYMRQLALAIARDKRVGAPRTQRPYLANSNMGFNQP